MAVSLLGTRQIRILEDFQEEAICFSYKLRTAHESLHSPVSSVAFFPETPFMLLIDIENRSAHHFRMKSNHSKME